MSEAPLSETQCGEPLDRERFYEASTTKQGSLRTQVFGGRKSRAMLGKAESSESPGQLGNIKTQIGNQRRLMFPYVIFMEI